MLNTEDNNLIHQLKKSGIDPTLICEFLESNIPVSQEFYELIKPNLPERNQLRKERMLSNASILLSLLRYPELP